MNQLKLRHLHAFITVVEEGNLTRAAERLCVQQPSLSRILQSLEQTLNAPLLIRLPRGVVPNEAGQILYDEAKIILARVDRLPKTIERVALGMEGNLRVGFTSSAALAPMVTAILNDYREQYPAVELQFEEAGSGELVSALFDEIVDVAFIRSVSFEQRQRLELIPVMQEPMLVALPARHPLAELTGPFELAALAGQSFVLYRRPHGPGLYDSILTACYQAGFSPTIVQEAPRLTTMMSLVAAGLGLSIVPMSLQRLGGTDIVYRPLSTKEPFQASIWLALNKATQSPGIQRFKQLVMSMCALDD